MMEKSSKAPDLLTEFVEHHKVVGKPFSADRLGSIKREIRADAALFIYQKGGKKQ